ncbi:MAG: hypothetical protein ACJ8FY_20870 [Gemmataceae bacterium]
MRRRRRTIAALILLIVVTGLGVTEATGITQFVATVQRSQTPDVGTLVVEVSDPQVKVTIEGDEGLVIAGTGSQEERLAPGRYQVQASKGNRPVHWELVTIRRDDKQVVKVSLEGYQSEPESTRRRAAEWILEIGGEVLTMPVGGGEWTRVAEAVDLPREAFWVHRIELERNRYVTDTGLEHLEALTELQGLVLLDCSRVTDAGLVHLKGLKRLYGLDLIGTQVTNRGLENLEGLTELGHLWLTGTRVTDAGLVHLQRLTKLQNLYLGKTKVSKAGRERIKAALPGCNVR